MRTDLESLEEFDSHLAGSKSLSAVFVQSVDLRGRSEELRAADVGGAVFLGCGLRSGDASSLARRGALVFPKLPDLPFDPYRPLLYTADDLYAGLEDGYDATLDARIFRWAKQRLRPGALDADLAAALHDHAITESLQQQLSDIAPTRIVGIMGGHAERRGSGPYRAAAALGHALATSGLVVISGGGPGAMEAANLGASFTGAAADLPGVVDALLHYSSWTENVTEWARSAQAVVRSHPSERLSIGIPTWFYGHEPPNLFATGIAKYFTNALREDVLLRLCRGGIVYLPGAAGTVQEVFQAVTPNYYAADGEPLTPLVLVGTEYWTETVPVWPLLHTLGRGRSLGDAVHLVDDVDEVTELLSAAEPAGPPSANR